MPPPPRSNVPAGWEVVADAPASAPSVASSVPHGWEVVDEAPTADAPEGKSVGGFLSNALDSGYNLAKGTVEGAVLVGKLANAAAHGGAEFVTDPQLRGMMQGAHDAGVGGIARGAKEYFGKRYGGLKEIGETAYTDPFGLAADAATVASLGGGAAARAPGVIGRVGRGVAALGSAVDPLAAAGRLGGAVAPAAGKLAERVGEGLNASALQISSKLKNANAGINIPRAMAEEGILATGRGRGALKALTTADDAELAGVIEGSAARLHPRDVTAPLEELATSKRGLMAGSPLADEAATVDRRVEQIIGANGADLAPPVGIPIQQAQRTKVALNERLAKSFGTTAAEPLPMEMAHAERKGLMSAIEAAEPGVAPINQRLGRRYAIGDAIDEMRARPAAVTPTDLLKGGIGSGIGAAVGGGIPGAVVGGAASLALKSPLVKSLAARELFRASRAAPGAAATFEASGPMLTRLAILARLQGDAPPE